MAPFLLVGLLLAGPTACNGLGGSEGQLGGGTPGTFAIATRTPNGGSAGIPTTTTIVVTFTSTIDETSVLPGVLTLNNSASGTFVVEGTKLTFTPSAELNPGSIYTVALSPDIQGVDGAHLGVIAPWGFKTAGTPPPPPPPDAGAARAPRPR